MRDLGFLPMTAKLELYSAKERLSSYFPGPGPSLGATQNVLRSVVEPKAPSFTPYDSARVRSS